MGRQQSLLAFPTVDETRGGYGNGWFSVFQGGRIYWSSTTGARWMTGDIRARYVAMGAEKSFLHYPTTNYLVTASGKGRYQHFQSGSIFWSSATGAHPVGGAIRNKWASLGWERSWLGYPRAGEFVITNGRRQNFQYGYITWNRTTGVVSNVPVLTTGRGYTGGSRRGRAGHVCWLSGVTTILGVPRHRQGDGAPLWSPTRPGSP